MCECSVYVLEKLLPVSFLLTVEHREAAFLQIPLSLIFVLLTPAVLKVLLRASATGKNRLQGHRDLAFYFLRGLLGVETHL